MLEENTTNTTCLTEMFNIKISYHDIYPSEMTSEIIIKNKLRFDTSTTCSWRGGEESLIAPPRAMTGDRKGSQGV